MSSSASSTENYSEQDILDTVAACLQLSNAGMVEGYTELFMELRKIAPDREEVKLLGGILHMILGEMKEAEIVFQEILTHKPDMAIAHFYLGVVRYRNHDLNQAIECFSQCLTYNPDYNEAYHYLCLINFALKNNELAFQIAMVGVERNPLNKALWHFIGRALTHTTLSQPVPIIEKALIAACESNEIDKKELGGVARVLLGQTKEAQACLSAHEKGELKPFLLEQGGIEMLAKSFFITMIHHVYMSHAGVERLIIALRDTLLEIIINQNYQEGEIEGLLDIASGCAHFAFHTDYIMYTEEENIALIRQARNEALNTSNPESFRALCAVIYAAYCNWSHDEERTGFIALCDTSDFALLHQLKKLLIDQANTEKEYKDKIVSLTDIDDEVSREVQSMYETSPYPRWQAYPEFRQRVFHFMIALEMPFLRPEERPTLQENEHAPLNVLVAGCGTGHHAMLAHCDYLNAQIMAVDLSRTSLAYAMMKAEAYGAENITFRHADLMKLPELGQQYDVIESAGVLHHMEHPEKGLQALTDCLKPGGWMKLALYNYDRRTVVHDSWKVIQEQSFSNSEEDIIRFRHEVMTQPEHRELLNRLAVSNDFFNTYECRDYLFHVQEHQYTLDQLRKMLNHCGLQFMGMLLHEPQRYHEFAGTDHEITNFRSMKQWEVAQRARPDLFPQMHTFWCRKPA